MTVKDILKIPVDHLLKDGGLLVVWSTNKPSQIQEFLQGLHTWGVEHIATWYWLKVVVMIMVIRLSGSWNTKSCEIGLYNVYGGAHKNSTIVIPAIPAVCKTTKGMEQGVWEAPPLYTLQKDKAQRGRGE